MQTNGVIYLPLVVKHATRVGGNVRRGSQQTRRIHPMLVQGCVSVSVLLTGIRLKIRSTARELTPELTARELKNCIKFYIYV